MPGERGARGLPASAGVPWAATVDWATDLLAPEGSAEGGLNHRLRCDAVGDGPVVARYGRWLGVDFAEEHVEGAGSAGFGRCLEGDADRGGDEGDGSGKASCIVASVPLADRV